MRGANSRNFTANGTRLTFNSHSLYVDRTWVFWIWNVENGCSRGRSELERLPGTKRSAGQKVPEGG